MTRRRARRGSALVEFAVAVGVFVPLLTGTFQFGYSFFVYNKLQNAVRAGARYASLRSYDSTTSTPSSAFSNAVKNVVVYGDPDGGATPATSGLSTNEVFVTVTMTSNVPSLVTVDIRGFAINGVFGTITLNSKPAATFRYAGRFAPPS